MEVAKGFPDFNSANLTLLRTQCVSSSMKPNTTLGLPSQQQQGRGLCHQRNSFGVNVDAKEQEIDARFL